jgi:dihydroorotase
MAVVPKGQDFQPLMTLYLTDKTTAAEVASTCPLLVPLLAPKLNVLIDP